MGALFTKPSMPDYSYGYSYTPSSTATSSISDTLSDTGTTTTGDASGSDAERAAAIAKRRAFPDTIQTSYRGVLQQGPWVPQRKSLLGE